MKSPSHSKKALRSKRTEIIVHFLKLSVRLKFSVNSQVSFPTFSKTTKMPTGPWKHFKNNAMGQNQILKSSPVRAITGQILKIRRSVRK